MKYGEEITFKEDFIIESLLNGIQHQIKKGDTALVTKYGNKILKGEGLGKIVITKDKPKGYDYGNIAKVIYRRLDNYFDLDYLLEYEGIDKERFIEEITDVIFDII